MRDENYGKIVWWCKNVVAEQPQPNFLFDPELFQKTIELKCLEHNCTYDSLMSLLRNIHLNHVKVSAPRVKRNMKSSIDTFTKGTSIKDISREAAFPPFLFARNMISEIIENDSKKNLTKLMRNPSLIVNETISKDFQLSGDIDSRRLAQEVQEAVACDTMYGPLHDRQRHFIGVEYEVALEHMLVSMGIPFLTEAELREKGSSRTPDILLSCPIAVKVNDEWRMVCWIDSKALFGDISTHEYSVLPQAESYVHRFGPGMICYWFGHAPVERLGNAKGDITIKGWELPQTIMWPTGEDQLEN